jgi:hypothetical protein
MFGFLRQEQLDKLLSIADGRSPSMIHAETVPTHLYPLYCDYIHHISRQHQPRRGKFADVSVASQPDFVAVWNTLPRSRQDFWQARFEAGYDRVAKSDRETLVAAFTSNMSRRIAA